MNRRWLGSLFLIIASSIWGGMYVVVKVVVNVIPPVELVWMRYLIAFFALITIGFMTKQSWRIKKQHIPLVISIALVGYVLSIVTQETGTMLSTAQMGAIITSTTPAFIVLFASILLKERLTFKKILSIFLATAGVIMIVGIDQLQFSNMLGGISLTIAALTWAYMSVLIKKLPNDYSQIVITAYATLIAFIALTPFVIPKLKYIPLTDLSEPTIWGGLLYLGIISTSLAFIFWNRGLQLLRASSGGVFFFFQPLVGAFLGWLLLGETLSMMFWIGAAFILIGVLFVINEGEQEDVIQDNEVISR